MHTFDKIYLKDKDNLVYDILDFYNKNWYWIVNFLYFASIVANNLLSNKENDNQKFYEKSLKNSSFLLPDWIALYLLLKFKFDKLVSNLNWTDFLPFFLNNIKSEKVNIILYWAHEQTIKKAWKFVQKNFWINPLYVQNWYTEFKFNWLKLSKKSINVMLVGLWSPKQEIRAYQNLDKIKKNWLLVFNVWWLFDFWWGKEKRAPRIIRKLRGEWIRRFITRPKKNFKKFFQSLYLIKLLLKKNH